MKSEKRTIILLGFVSCLIGLAACESAQLDLQTWPEDRAAAAFRVEASSPGPLVKLGTGSVFSARTASAGREPWISDGTVQGTRMLQDIRPGEEGSHPTHLVALGTSRVFFVADDGTTGRELWTSTGTPTSTVRLTSLSDGEQIGTVWAASSWLAFSVRSNNGATTWWKTQGTTSTTLAAASVGQAFLESTASLGDVLYYVTREPVCGADPNNCGVLRKIWKLDLATNSAAVAIFSSEDATNIYLTAGTSRLYIVKRTEIQDELYTYSGSGTPLLLAAFDSDTVALMTQAGSYFYFFAGRTSGTTYFEGLYRSDGTAAGTKAVAQMPTEAHPVFAVMNKALYFRSGTDLRRVSGTTVSSVKSNAGTIDEIVSTNTSSSGTVFYLTADRTELWRTSGSTPTRVQAATGQSLAHLCAFSSSGIQYVDRFEAGFRLRKCTTSGQVSDLNTSFVREVQTTVFRFEAGQMNGFTVGQTDFTAETVGELEHSIEPLPAPLDGSALRVSSLNRSDDQWVYIARQLGPAEGVVPLATYEASIHAILASNAPQGCMGVGGSPDSVYIKAGVTDHIPEPVEEGNGYVGFSIDKGNQSQIGPEALDFGRITTSGTDCMGVNPWELLERSGSMFATADAQGHLWLYMGTDSGYESGFTLYYQSLTVSLARL